MTMQLIQSISDYLKWVEKISKRNAKKIIQPENLYFRGHADINWKLETSLNRSKINEYNSIQMASKLCWSILPTISSSLEKLITFQHHGLHTRLLDVTTNPLIALFFACQSVKHKIPTNIAGEYKSKLCRINCTEKDGSVFYGQRNKTEYLNIAASIAEIISNEPQIDIIEETHIEVWNKKYNKGKEPLSFDNLSTPHYIAPPVTTPRILNQQGAFIMSPLIEKQHGKYTWCNDYIYKQGNKNEFFEKQFCIIPAARKKDILVELNKLGVNQSTIFPDIDNILSYINQKCGILNFEIDTSETQENPHVKINQNCKAIFFDLDNTLIFTDEANNLSYTKAITEFIKNKISSHSSNERFTRELLCKIDLLSNYSDIERIISEKEKCYDLYIHKTRLNEAISYHLFNKKKNCIYVLCSNASKLRGMQLLEYHNIKNKFDQIFFKEDIIEGKNKYESAISNLNIDNKDIVAFENDETEKSNAKKIGINIINI